MRFLIVISHFPAARFQISARGFFRQSFPKCSPTAHIQSVFHLEGLFYVCLRQSFPPIFLVVLPALYFYILFFKKKPTHLRALQNFRLGSSFRQSFQLFFACSVFWIVFSQFFCLRRTFTQLFSTFTCSALLNSVFKTFTRNTL